MNDMAKFLALIYGDEQTWDGWSDEQATANGEAHGAFNAVAGSAVVGGHELVRSKHARNIRADGSGGQSVSAGPFPDSAVVLGGFYVLEAEDLDAAVALARQLPEASAPSSGVEVRPVQTG